MFRQKKTVTHKIPRLRRWGSRGIAVLSVIAILFSFFCFPVGALTSFQPSFDKPTFFTAISTSDNTSFIGTTDVPNGATFGVNQGQGFSYVDLPKNFSNCDSLRVRIPFTMNVPAGNYWSGNFVFEPTFHLAGPTSSPNHPFKNFTLRYYLNGKSGDVVFSSEVTQSNGKITVNIPPNNNIGSIEFYFYFQPTENFTFKIVRFYFKNFNLKYGLEGEFTSEIAQNSEEEKANEGGKQSTDKAQNAIPSVNSGFSDSLKSFVNSMSYNGTDALLPIPKAVVPAISGITDEIEIIPAQNYDLSAAINQYIPKTLLELIRYLFTIALVLYCVYELYGFIQYVLTLKKGGKNE